MSIVVYMRMFFSSQLIIQIKSINRYFSRGDLDRDNFLEYALFDGSLWRIRRIPKQ